MIDRAIGSDQGLKYVYVVTKDNKIEYRRVTTGALQEDGLRVILTGLEIQRIDCWSEVCNWFDPKMEIKPDRDGHANAGTGRGRRERQIGRRERQFRKRGRRK